ncbi:hypothetical protein [Arthrobacter sp. STN4]|uniref:hypothetical protein n=1 Tax=Arthrobacter sp. STN4 TaxID=2923276 RepID=UPI002119E4D7|nr:hypothetical protein [Arthrobacter sp. STN4]MCQ9162979.1 hypothetical protein [Arthrobacter sp. STN4]
MTTTTDTSLSDALIGFHTDDLIGLIAALAAVQDGRIILGSPDHAELVDQELLAEVSEAMALTSIDLLIEAVQGGLEERHWEIEAAMEAWALWGHRTVSWAAALLDAADAVRGREMGQNDRLGAVSTFTAFTAA